MKREKKFFSQMLLAFTAVFLACGLLGVNPISAQAAARPSISTKKATINVGQTKTVSVKNASAAVKWSSSNRKVVKIKKTSGKNKATVQLEAIKPGTATIKAKVNGKTLSVKVTVRRMTASKKSVTVTEGKSASLSVKNAGKKVTWSSSNKKVVKIQKASGKNSSKVTIQAVGSGSAKVTAKIGSYKVSINVKTNHRAVAATCEQGSYCSVCKKSLSQPLGHKAVAATCEQGSYCAVCKKSLSQPQGHKAVAATCEQGSYCSVCKKSLSQPLDHKVVPANCKQGSYCSVCKKSLSGTVDHTWDYITGRCTTAGCDEINLKHYFSFQITNCGRETDIIWIHLIKRNPFVIVDDSFEIAIKTQGMAVVNSGGKKIDARLWDMSDQDYYTGLRYRTGLSGTGDISFATTSRFALGFRDTIEFHLYFDRKDYKLTVSKDDFTWVRQ